MPTLYVRDVPEKIYHQIREIAYAQNQSLSAYVVTVLEQAIEDEKVQSNRSNALSVIRRRRRKLPENAPDSVILLRQIRKDNE